MEKKNRMYRGSKVELSVDGTLVCAKHGEVLEIIGKGNDREIICQSCREELIAEQARPLSLSKEQGFPREFHRSRKCLE